MIRTYSELIKLPTFEERFEYLKLNGSVGSETFGFDRYLNQKFYKTAEWKRIRDEVIIRDLACDLGISDRPIIADYYGKRQILGRIYIHHMNPININDILESTSYLTNPEYLIVTTHETHNAIHYGDSSLLINSKLVERSANDTCPWRRME